MKSLWSDELRSRMAEFELDAPQALYEQVMQALPAAEVAPRQRVIPLWVRYAAAMVVVALLTGGYLFLREEPQPATPTLVAQLTDIQGPAAEELSERDDNRERSPLGAALQQAIESRKNLILQGVSERSADAAPVEDMLYEAKQATPALLESEEKSAALPAEEDGVVSEELTTQDTPSPQPSNTPLSQPSESPAQATRREERRAKRESARRQRSREYLAQLTSRERGVLEAKVYAAGISAGHSQQGVQQVFTVNSALFGSSDKTLGSDMVLFNAENTLRDDMRHSQPLRFGFSLRYYFNQHWGIESGVNYTKLHSRWEAGAHNSLYVERTSLHYLGLPVNAVYNIWSNRVVSIYLSAGAMVEKCVSGSLRSYYEIGSEKSHEQRRDIMVRQVQLSAQAAAGLQLNLSRVVGLYVEPGVGYWFDNGSTVETIYSEQPLNFNLNIGLRISLR